MIGGRLSLILLTAALLLLPCSTLKAQAHYAGEGPGSYTSIGVAGSAFNADYGKQKLAGFALFADANVYRRIGVEAEYRSLRYRATQNLSESTYLIGPRISTHGRDLRPYAKFLIGRGHLQYPYNFAKGSYFALGPGAGLDWRVRGSRLSVRVVDFEYQIWPRFTFGSLHPYGLSTGVSFRVF